MSDSVSEVKYLPIFVNLKDCRIKPIRNWHHWLTRWKKAQCYQEMLGLLHTGFDVPFGPEPGEQEYPVTDRVLFYLEASEGWNNTSLLGNPKDSRFAHQVGTKEGVTICKTEVQMRQALAEKAFSVLCTKHFKEQQLTTVESSDLEYDSVWDETISELYPSVSHFFRIGKRYGVSGLLNLSQVRRDKDRSHLENIAVEFLTNLARYLWGWKPTDTGCWMSKEEIAMFKAADQLKKERIELAKPWMLEVLNALQKLDVLLEFKEVDEASINKLQKIGLQTYLDPYYHPVKMRRRVTSLEEAAYAGSQAAMIALQLKLGQTVRTRLVNIQNAEVTKKEAEEKLAALNKG